MLAGAALFSCHRRFACYHFPKMHWDGAISAWNILSTAIVLTGIVMAFYRFVSKNRDSVTTLTNATNNLAAITERLKTAVEHQGAQVDAVKTAQATDKADLLAHQAKVKEALVAQNADIGTIVAVHIGKDDERFSALAATLTRIDAKLDRQASA